VKWLDREWNSSLDILGKNTSVDTHFPVINQPEREIGHLPLLIAEI
jgi:hypothetical protein